MLFNTNIRFNYYLAKYLWKCYPYYFLVFWFWSHKMKLYLWSDIMKFIFLDLSKTRVKEILWSKNSSWVALRAENQKPPKYLPSWWQAKEIISICEMQLYQFEQFYLRKQRSHLKWNTTQRFTRVLELSSYCSLYLVRKQIYCFEIHCYRIHYGTINLL